MNSKRVIAINLPQFHPFPENDEWWGKGFTEWTNVTKARPRFPGHYQPHLPSDTGFYDLRLPEARQMQADLAKKYGIYGFCYYHYWFNGKQLMERPVNEILSTGKPDFPFMLCWANENWARNWDGGFKHLLMEQKYTDEDDAAHMEYLCTHVFSDKRYIKINGKPFFAVYKAHLFPDIEKTIKIWRAVAASHNIELYLALFEHTNYNIPEYLSKGFDMSINFQPFCMGKFQYFKRFTNIVLNKTFHTRITELYSYSEEENLQDLEVCALNHNHTIMPSIVIQNYPSKEVKEQLEPGSIIAFPINDTVIQELSTIIRYVESKGYKIVNLKEHLTE